MNRKERKSQNGSGRYLMFLIVLITVLIAAVPFRMIRRYQKENSQKKISVIFISKRLDEENDFWSSMLEGTNMAAAEYNIELTAMGPKSESEIERQNEMIEEAIKMKPDAIVLVPSDVEQTISYARKIEAAGIELVLMDSVMEEEAGSCVVSTDNYEGGRKMGEYLKDHIGQSAVIGIVAHSPTSSTAIDRERGVRAGLDEYEEQIREVVYCYADEQKAYDVTSELLMRNPDMNMIAGLNEDSAVGAAKAIRDAGRSEQITLIGFDSSIEQVYLLEEGVFNAIVIQKPLNMGYLGIQAAYHTVTGTAVDDTIDSGSVLITKETIYTRENEKLLFPFRQSD